MTIPNSLGKQRRSWLSDCATRKKVVGLILHGVNGILKLTFPAAISSGVGSASNRNEYQGYLLRNEGAQCLRLTILPPSCADYLDILGASTSWSPKGRSRDVMG
jgi:hypothetical protein